jgi:hypothetical protein
MILTGRSKGPILVLAVLLVAGGIALIMVGILFRRPVAASPKRGTTPSSDNWRPPDADAVKKIVQGE